MGVREAAEGRRRRAEARVEPDFTKMVFPGLNRAGFGSGRTYAMWLIHLGTELGSARLRDADSAARAVLLGKVRRRGRVHAVWCSKPGANVTVGGAQSETQAEPLSVRGCSKRSGMLYGARRRSFSESAKFGRPVLNLERS